MKKLVFTALLIIAVAVLTFYLKDINNVFSLYALKSTLWGLLPWLYFTFICFFINNKRTLVSILFVVVIFGGLGIGIMADALFFHLDAQGGLVLFFIPLWQLILFVLITPLFFIFRNTKT